MEQMMTWSNSPKRAGISPEGTVEKFREPVCEVIRDNKHHGIKAAIGLASSTLGISSRRVRACWHNEVRAVLAHELEQVRRGYRDWVLARRTMLEAEIQRLENQIREMENDE